MPTKPINQPPIDLGNGKVRYQLSAATVTVKAKPSLGSKVKKDPKNQ